ncbi:hypothetical protein [Marinomonas transparens]|uniref:Uncharacterized protein n=1 Tax=Marinomonas transparens TaxID=2795388 RepID=A0A934JWW1_9GAMM|nr:hypothetical protein [Marinomonas transparens]MBJ7539871.1 hypothetical protein [Marinomonas transparens]
MSDSIVLKALIFYQAKVQKEFDKLEAVFSARPGSELVDVMREAQEIISKPNWFETHNARFQELADKEKQLSAVMKKQLNRKASDKHMSLRLELEELAREIAREEFSQRRRA